MNQELVSACPEHDGGPLGSDSDGHRGLTRQSTEGSGKIRSRLVRKPRRSLLSYPVLFTNFVLLWLAVQSPAQYTVASAAVAPALDRVLELDGQGSYFVLPENLLADLAEVTVEGWINWGSFRNASRFFDFGAGPFQINLQNRTTTSTLWFESPRGNTETRLEYEKTHEFYQCGNPTCQRITFEMAMETVFRCPTCDEPLKRLDNTACIEFLEGKIKELKEDLNA